MIFYLIGGLIGFLSSFFWRDIILDFLIKYNFKKVNYRNKKVPVGMGILLFFSTLIAAYFIIFLLSRLLSIIFFYLVFRSLHLLVFWMTVLMKKR